MIELYAFLTLIGLGYILSKNTSVPQNDKMPIHRNELPSMNNLYDSSFYNEVQSQEIKAANTSFEESQKPQPTTINNTYREDEQYSKRQKIVKSPLSGLEIPVDDFVHNNMMPYFGGSIRQSIDPFANENVLERFTGQDILKPTKREQKPLFDSRKNKDLVCGSQVKIDEYYDRFVPPTIRNSERPFEQIQVGPGVNQGYSATPTGGFQQYEIRDIMMPKNVDELRVGTNPKTTYEGRIIEGQGITKPGKLGATNKNRPDTYYENSADRYFTTTGAFVKPTERPCTEAKDTNRQDTTKEHFGGANVNIAQKLDGLVKESAKQQLEDFGFRNLDGDDIGQGDKTDYGKQNIMVCENERDNTAERTYQGNLISLVKSITAPLEDIFKETRKEYMVENPRPYGSLQPQFPDKLTVKDPNDVTRTTIKETLIHDTIETGNLRGPVKLAVYDPDEIAKRTIRETTRPEETVINLSGAGKKTTARDPDDKAFTTMKETLIEGERYGNIEGLQGEKGGYTSADYHAPTTQKEFFSDNDYYGTATKTDNDGYKVANTVVPETQKQFISDKDYIGVADGGEKKKPKSYDDIYNAEMNELREGTLEGREPTKESAKISNGMDAVNMTTRKLDIDTCTERVTNNIDNIINQPITGKDINITTYKEEYCPEDRLDINMLSSLQSNPYAIKPLAGEDGGSLVATPFKVGNCG